MAAIKPTLVQIGRQDESCYRATWANVTENDSCVALEMPNLNDKSVAITGSFGGATLSVAGSNDDGANFWPLRSPDSVVISMTSAGLKAILENPQQIKPVMTGGTAQSVTITMVLHQTNPLRQ